MPESVTNDDVQKGLRAGWARLVKSLGLSNLYSSARPQSRLDVLLEEAQEIHGLQMRFLPDRYQPGQSVEERERLDLIDFGRAIDQLGDGKERTALCLSGGGIRSATFSLGFLQALVCHEGLSRIHYLSTVSGGGYIGSWLSTWISRKGLPEVEAALRDEVREPATIDHLRANSSYLAPKNGLSTDLLTLIGVTARNLFLNWLVLVPFIASILLIPRLYLWLLAWGSTSQSAVWVGYILLGIGGAIAAAVVGFVWRNLPMDGDRAARSGRRTPFVIWLPVASLLIALGWRCVGKNATPELPFVFGLLAAIAGVITGALVKPRREALTLESIVLAAVGGLVGGGALFLLAALADTAQTPTDQLSSYLVSYCILGAPILLIAHWFATIAVVGIGGSSRSEDWREWWARSGALVLRPMLGWLLVTSLVILGPKMLSWAVERAPIVVATSGGFAGLAAALIGSRGTGGMADPFQQGAGIASKLGRNFLPFCAAAFATLLLVAFSLATTVALAPEATRSAVAQTSYEIAKTHEAKKSAEPAQAASTGTVTPDLTSSFVSSVVGIAKVHDAVLMGNTTGTTSDLPAPSFIATGEKLIAALVLLAAFAFVMSWRIGVNTFSLHSMYGNRLVRAYLGASRRRKPNALTNFDPKDNLSVTKLWDKDEAEAGRPPQPFHVFNLALNLTSGDHLSWQQRKAASFIVTPLYSGSAITGYQRSAHYGGKDGISVGKAMTISGAAVNPAMGYHSSAPVSAVMAFFNTRLGWWLPNPRAAADVRRASEPGIGLWPLIAELTGVANDRSNWIYMSDGGHFDNLGLYEMVLRRCKRIIVVDGTEDPDYEYEDLARCIRMIRTDLGVEITFEELPSATRDKRWAIGRVRYSRLDASVEDGFIAYVKPVVVGDEPVDVLDYTRQRRAAGERFPHEATSDQFFDEAQFESYRRLGRLTGERLFASSENPLAQNVQALVGKVDVDKNATMAGPALETAGSSAGTAAVFGWIGKLFEQGSAWAGPAVASTFAAVTVSTVVSGTVALSTKSIKLDADNLKLDPATTVSLAKPDPLELKDRTLTLVPPAPLKVEPVAIRFEPRPGPSSPPGQPPQGPGGSGDDWKEADGKLRVGIELVGEENLQKLLTALSSDQTGKKTLEVIVKPGDGAEKLIRDLAAASATSQTTWKHDVDISPQDMAAIGDLAKAIRDTKIQMEGLESLVRSVDAVGGKVDVVASKVNEVGQGIQDVAGRSSMAGGRP